MFHIYTDAKAEIRHVMGSKCPRENEKKKGETATTHGCLTFTKGYKDQERKPKRERHLYKRCGAILLLRRIRLRSHEQALSKRWYTSGLQKQVGACIAIGSTELRERSSGRSSARRHDGRAERVRCASTEPETGCLRTKPSANQGTSAKWSPTRFPNWRKVN
jgi:hypothetical protein